MENQAYGLTNAGIYSYNKSSYPVKDAGAEYNNTTCQSSSSFNEEDSAQVYVTDTLKDFYPDATEAELAVMSSSPLAFKSSIKSAQTDKSIKYLDKIAGADMILNIASNVDGYINYANYYAKRNNKSQAFSMLQQAFSDVRSGLSTLNLNSFTGRLQDMESAIAASQQQVEGIELSDEELLRLTGVDSKGKDFRDHIQNKIAGLSLSTTPRSTFESLISQLNSSPVSSSDIKNMLDEILNKKQSSSTERSGGSLVLGILSSSSKNTGYSFANSGLTRSSSDKEGSTIVKA